jgi:hypothetical protein
MPAQYLHERKDFEVLLSTLSEELGILPALVEKDYWIMQSLNGLLTCGLSFELKGGTSLSKGYNIIERFSEDIDLHISPPQKFIEETQIIVNENPRATSKSAIANREILFDWLAHNIQIDGITEINRDKAFDDEKFRSAGIRLIYPTLFDPVPGIKNGILLEIGFAKVTPNSPLTISSWMYDKAVKAKLKIRDNRAQDILCYHPGYTLVEKLQTISTKYRADQSEGKRDKARVNFMRQYYDVYNLLKQDEIVEFIGTNEYREHKVFWFPEADIMIPITENQAFLLEDNDTRADYKKRYASTSALYYSGQPDFDEMIEFIGTFLDML